MTTQRPCLRANPYVLRICEYYIPDFSNWKEYEYDAFEAEFAKLLRHLKAT